MNERGKFMTTLEKKIQQYYTDFNKDFNKKNFPAVYEKIDEHNAKEKRGKEHDLGSFAILYTPVRYKPDIMLIGNNPSWFDKKDSKKGYKIVKELMESPPQDNSYMVHNHVFADSMQRIFGHVGRTDLLETCVGMNRLWLQTGSTYTSWNTACNKRSLTFGQSLTDYCETKTKEIIELIEPKVVLLIGKKAWNLFQSDTKPSNIKYVDYPYSKGNISLQEDLEKIIKTEIR